jgi:peptidoglycan lytic transglycosylase G
MKKLLIALFILILAGLAAASVYVRDDLSKPYPEAAAPRFVEIPHGMRARDVVGLLRDKNVIRDEYAALAYIWYSGNRHKLQAGEYLFDRPMTPIEVVSRIADGNVYLHKFTVPEGLTLAETAEKWQDQGFGTAESFQQAAAESVALIQDLDPKALSLEGYLFPETYSFPAHTPARKAVEAMVTRFKGMLGRLDEDVPPPQRPLSLRDTIILASLVESEAAHEDERPLVASVYLNRIQKKMLLQCDPTVIYALEKEARYNGKLTRADLKFQSPYNTYVSPGLPPGPIMNPGFPALRAAMQPAVTKHLYFVRTVEGRHTFSDNLSAHNRAVAAYRALQRGGK